MLLGKLTAPAAGATASPTVQIEGLLSKPVTRDDNVLKDVDTLPEFVRLLPVSDALKTLFVDGLNNQGLSLSLLSASPTLLGLYQQLVNLPSGLAIQAARFLFACKQAGTEVDGVEF